MLRLHSTRRNSQTVTVPRRSTTLKRNEIGEVLDGENKEKRKMFSDQRKNKNGHQRENLHEKIKPDRGDRNTIKNGITIRIKTKNYQNIEFTKRIRDRDRRSEGIG